MHVRQGKKVLLWAGWREVQQSRQVSGEVVWDIVAACISYVEVWDGGGDEVDRVGA